MSNDDRYELAADTKKLHKMLRRRKLRRTIEFLLAAITVFVTTYALMMPAISFGSAAHCGKTEHIHCDDCYELRLSCGFEENKSAEPQYFNRNLICNEAEHLHDGNCFDEDGVLICGKNEHIHSESCYEIAESKAGPESKPAHVHTEGCYKKVLICGFEEHTHIKQCYSDPKADTDGSKWIAAANDAVGRLPDNAPPSSRLAAAAESQIGYRESAKNYRIRKDGIRQDGYTIYGAEFDNAYGDWCAMFLGWCMDRAGVDHMPVSFSCSKWVDMIRSDTNFWKTGSPAAGDLVFFDLDKNGDADHAGVVVKTELSQDKTDTVITTVEGNSSNCVKSNKYELSDRRIAGFAAVTSEDVLLQTLADGSTMYTADRGDLLVRVTAAPGALPGNTSMIVTDVAADVVSAPESDNVVRAVDISFLDSTGTEIEPYEPLQVQMISSAIRQASDNGRKLNIVHMSDEAEIIDSFTEDQTISFEAAGFSVYAIVEAPETEEIDPVIHTPDQLAEYTFSGFTLSVSRNPGYFKNSLNQNGAFEVGNSAEAATWFFEPAGDQSDQYRIYTYTDGEKKYMKKTGDRTMSLDPDAGTFFEIDQAGETGKFYIKVVGENRWLQYSGSGGGFRLYSDNNNATNSKISITMVIDDSVEYDPYGLDGKTYGIAYHTEDVKAAALTAETTLNRIVSDKMIVRRDILDNSGNLLVAPDKDIVEWTFKCVEGNNYYI